MPTVVVRFEPNKKNPERGTIYYRIYKGHNQRILSPVVSVSKLRRIFGF